MVFHSPQQVRGARGAHAQVPPEDRAVLLQRLPVTPVPVSYTHLTLPTKA